MMHVCRKLSSFDYLRDAYYKAPRTVEEIERRIGGSDLKDFWFDFAFDKPAVFFRYRTNGREIVDFVRLEK